jgi:hypothetical protein
MGRLYFDNDMVGRADYLLTGTPDMSGMHADLVPAGCMRDNRTLRIDPQVERSFRTLYPEINLFVNGITRQHAAVATYRDYRRPALLHDRNKSDSGRGYCGDKQQVNQAEAADFRRGWPMRLVHTFHPFVASECLQ